MTIVIHRRGAVQALCSYPAGRSARRYARASEAGRRFFDFGIVHTVNEEFQRKADRRRDDERRTGADDAQRREANAENAGQQSKKHAAEQRTEQRRDDHDPCILCVHLRFPCFGVKAHKVQSQQHAEG